MEAPTIVLHNVAKTYDTPAGRHPRSPQPLPTWRSRRRPSASLWLSREVGQRQQSTPPPHRRHRSGQRGRGHGRGRRLGRALRGAPRRMAAVHRAGVVFQFFQLLPTLTTVENVMLPDAPPRFFPARPPAQALLLLDLRGHTATRRTSCPPPSSGGQQQRAAIARSLADDLSRGHRRRAHGRPSICPPPPPLFSSASLARCGTTVVIATHRSGA